MMAAIALVYLAHLFRDSLDQFYLFSFAQRANVVNKKVTYINLGFAVANKSDKKLLDFFIIAHVLMC